MTENTEQNSNEPVAQDDVQGHMIALYEGDPGNKGRPHPGVPAGAAGRDPAGIVAEVGHNVRILLGIPPNLPF